MTSDQFRRLALSFPEAAESAHMGHPDFRVGGKIFATLGHPDESWAMVKLTPEQQEELVRTQPAIFAPVKGGWGRQGATNVHLKPAKKGIVQQALAAAWGNRAQRRAGGQESLNPSSQRKVR
ncbi:MAG TPA: MmcQ/YjbR family DNA-binding protein [Terriglobia bacterium]|jgi:hypothetical protein|nr:MmcQ/YjbR family DNA-binding protein [Terriglobia bacterium]